MNSLPFAKKSLGQHWLEDEASLMAMIKPANISASDFILEIGPGTGTLTKMLINTNAKILALEFDSQRIVELKTKFKNYSNLEIHNGDIRQFDISSLPARFKIVANIPYYLTANLLRALTETANKPIIAVLLVQKEVAKRICSKPGDLSKLSVFVQNYYDVNVGQVVTADKFIPSPKVDSQVVILKKRELPLIKLNRNIENLIEIGFEHKRKKLSSNLANDLKIPKTEVEQILLENGIRKDARAQDLNIKDWQKIAKKVLDKLIINE